MKELHRRESGVIRRGKKGVSKLNFKHDIYFWASCTIILKHCQLILVLLYIRLSIWHLQLLSRTCLLLISIVMKQDWLLFVGCVVNRCVYLEYMEISSIIKSGNFVGARRITKPR